MQRCMSVYCCGHALVLLIFGLVSLAATAETAPPVAVVPSKVNMLIGESHTFRAVGHDGHLLHNVTWSVSPFAAVTLTTSEDEVTVQANQASDEVTLTASCSEGNAEAIIEIHAGTSQPEGSTLWSVKELPGCKTTKIIPAVPSDGGPDIYAQESCPDGTYIRAITADGRELWRHNFSEGPNTKKPESAPPDFSGEHLDTSAHSICTDVSTGMSKADVWKLTEIRQLAVGEEERKSNRWILEEPGSQCSVFFDENGTVSRKKKTLTTD